MHIEILTIFPEYFRSPLSESLLGKGIAAGLLEVVVTDLRQFATDRHHKVDDEPYGGGPGMVMMAPVVAAAVEARRGSPPAWSVLLAPDGERLDQGKLADLSRQSRLLLFCGRYEASTSAPGSLASSIRRFPWATSCSPAGSCRSRSSRALTARSRGVARAESIEQSPSSGSVWTTPIHAPPQFRGSPSPGAPFRDHARIERWRKARGPWKATRHRRPDLLVEARGAGRKWDE